MGHKAKNTASIFKQDKAVSRSRRHTSHGNAERKAKNEIFQGLLAVSAYRSYHRQKVSAGAILTKNRAQTPQNIRRIKG